MKRIGYPILTMLPVCVAVVATSSAALATPEPTSAVVTERVFNHCPITNLSTLNTYPGAVTFSEVWPDDCATYANRHNWRFSTDGSTAAVFGNNNDFKYSTILTITGNGTASAGLEIAPWWLPNAGGRLQVRIPDGEIAAFDGLLPTYSFSDFDGHNVWYFGGPIYMEIEYHANGLSMASPATIEYRIVYNGTPYASGPLNFDQGNPAEDPPHGQWGMLDPAYVGGMVETNNGPILYARQWNVSFTDINFLCLDCATPAASSSWGRIKATYR